MNETINITRLKEAILWLRDNEVYTGYYENLAIRLTPALGDCFRMVLSQLDSKKHIAFVLLPEDMEYFTHIVNEKLLELWAHV